jgi:hypothetical protein
MSSSLFRFLFAYVRCSSFFFGRIAARATLLETHWRRARFLAYLAFNGPNRRRSRQHCIM